MSDQTGTQVPAQGGIEDFNGIFLERLRCIVREGLLLMFEQEVTSLCGETSPQGHQCQDLRYDLRATFTSSPERAISRLPGTQTALK